MITLTRSNEDLEREPLKAPFGFKGNYVRNVWQSCVLLHDDTGRTGLGLGTQSPLWSDAEFFSSYSEAGSNAAMFLLTSYATRQAIGLSFKDPFELLDQLLPKVEAFARQLAGRRLRTTFSLNALVALDNAVWQLYAAEKGSADLTQLLPAALAEPLRFKHESISNIPLVSYGTSIEEVVNFLDQGWFFLKIKIGSDPDKDGDQEKMLAWDQERLSQIHAAVKDRETPHTENGRIPYYLDANGRYDSKDRLLRLLDHAEKIGALERIVILEEPFPEDYRADVHDVPVRLAADESAHSDRDAAERIDLGYRAIALKPIAKTLSMSLRIAKLAQDRQIPCFCADLTVNPILVDWNKNMAARLAPLPGLRVVAFESNGNQNYRNWPRMTTYHPVYPAPWIDIVGGRYRLNHQFYRCSGGIFEQSRHYLERLT